MATTLTGPAVDPDALITELVGHVGLSEVDAVSGAFIAIAYGCGWSQARISRYLGVSRARVAQRVEALRGYVDGYYLSVSNGDGKEEVHYIEPRVMPVLKTTLQSRPKKIPPSPDWPVCFTQEDWRNREFANALISQLLER